MWILKILFLKVIISRDSPLLMGEMYDERIPVEY